VVGGKNVTIDRFEKRDSNPPSSGLEADAMTTVPRRQARTEQDSVILGSPGVGCKKYIFETFISIKYTQ
jgi:hypothetical protein